MKKLKSDALKMVKANRGGQKKAGKAKASMSKMSKMMDKDKDMSKDMGY